MTESSAVFECVKDVIVIRVQDHELSHHTGESIEAQMPVCQNGREPLKFVLDLSNITFMGSIGLTVLVVLLKRVKAAGGQLVIAGLTGRCRHVMSVTGLNRVFEFYTTTDKAVAALQPSETGAGLIG